MPRRRKGLTAEDRAVWETVTKTARPLNPDRPKEEERPTQKPLKSRLAPDSGAPQPVRPFRVGESAASPHRSFAQRAPTIAEDLASEPLRMDKKRYQKMKRGKIVPERKIDLHGLTLAQAHPALIRFVQAAASEGIRTVLVVTGKGKSKPDSGPIPTRMGALRHEVPHWLRMPPLKPFVLQVTEAHQSHGGAGAYYVVLARRR